MQKAQSNIIRKGKVMNPETKQILTITLSLLAISMSLWSLWTSRKAEKEIKKQKRNLNL